MSTPIDTVNTFLSAYWTGTIDETLAIITDDFEWINMPLPKLTRRGRQAMADLMANNRGSWPEEPEQGEHIMLRAIVDGDFVMHERVDRFKFRGRWVELPCNGIWEVRSGKVRLWKDYFDLGVYVRGMAGVGIEVGQGFERYY